MAAAGLVLGEKEHSNNHASLGQWSILNFVSILCCERTNGTVLLTVHCTDGLPLSLNVHAKWFRRSVLLSHHVVFDSDV